MQHRPLMSPEERRRLEALLATCRSSQGEYRFPHHGAGSWATTYGTDFVVAATEIFRMYGAASLDPPIPEGRGARYVVTAMFDWVVFAFSNAGVRSCRGATMNRETVRYLFEAHVYERLYPSEKR